MCLFLMEFYHFHRMWHVFAGLMVCISVDLVLFSCCHFSLLCLCHV
jgi:hypothetical protein